MEVDATHPIQDALQGLDVAAPELLGLFLGSHRVRVRQGRLELLKWAWVEEYLGKGRQPGDSGMARLKAFMSPERGRKQVTDQALRDLPVLPHPEL